MNMYGSVSITGSSNGAGGQRQLAVYVVQGINDIEETIDLVLASGANVLSVPSGSVGVVIVPSSGTTGTLTVKTSLNASDTGFPISITQPTPYVFPTTAPTTVTLTASAVGSGETQLWFW